MVPDLACFALFLAHDHESVFGGIKIANTASLVIDRESVTAHPYSSFSQKHRQTFSLPSLILRNGHCLACVHPFRDVRR